jgi:hypothetical protein
MTIECRAPAYAALVAERLLWAYLLSVRVPNASSTGTKRTISGIYRTGIGCEATHRLSERIWGGEKTE